MKNFLPLLLFALLFSGQEGQVNGQNLNSPGEYISFIGSQYSEITKDMLSYMSSVAHSKNARKTENKRKEIIQTNREARKKIAGMPAFQGDKSLRDSAVAFLDLSHHVLNDDYDKIIDMEEVAEQSYDAMEAYLLAQEKASDKMEEAGKRLDIVQKDFAAKYKVDLVEKQDEVSKKMEQASRASKYNRVVYLIFFKSYKQDLYLVDAVSKKNVNGIEQNKNSLLQYADEGLAKLDSLKSFQGDNSLILSCRQALLFYKDEVKKIPTLVGYYIKEENFQKIKKAFDAKKQSDRTQADVDQYNKAANEMNKSINEYNTTNTQLNENRNKVIEGWNKASAAFLAKHTPKYK